MLLVFSFAEFNFQCINGPLEWQGQWRTGGIWRVQPPSPSKFRSFAKAEPNSQFHGIYIREYGFHSFANWVELLTKGLPPTDPRSLCLLSTTEFAEHHPPEKKSLARHWKRAFWCMNKKRVSHVASITSDSLTKGHTDTYKLHQQLPRVYLHMCLSAFYYLHMFIYSFICLLIHLLKTYLITLSAAQPITAAYNTW
jgi:hypothetical protein